jgi:glycosyltransferase involved in cell wall biosynthesis
VKVFVLTYDFPSDESPASGRFILRHVTALARRHDVRVVQARVQLGLPTATTVRSRDVDGTTVEEIVVRGLPGAAHLRAARLVSARVTGTDLLHTMALESLFLGSLVRRRVPWVHTEHSTEWTDPTASGLLRYWVGLSRSQIGRPDAVTAVSCYLAAAVERRRGQGDVAIVPNVVSVPEPGPDHAAPATDGRVRVISAGALVEMKRPLLAVDILAELVRRDLDTHWTWIGDGPLAPAMRDRAHRLGVADRLELLPFLEPADYLARVRQADVFLLPSAYKTFCVVAAEAIGCGVPVVLSARGGQQDFVGPDSGRLVADANPASYAQAVKDLLTDGPDREARLSAAAELRTRFAESAVATEFDKVYGTVVGPAKATGATRP